MLALGKKIDYALISLAYLTQNPGRRASAREIAEAGHVPVLLLMRILKRLQCSGLLGSTRGIRGGYHLAADLNCVSLQQLSDMLEDLDGSPEPADCLCDPTLLRMRSRLRLFLQQVRVSEVVAPGRHVHVPLDRVGISEKRRTVSV